MDFKNFTKISSKRTLMVGTDILISLIYLLASKEISDTHDLKNALLVFNDKPNDTLIFLRKLSFDSLLWLQKV